MIVQGDILVDLSYNKKLLVNHVKLKHPLLSIIILKLLIQVYLHFDDFFRVSVLCFGEYKARLSCFVKTILAFLGSEVETLYTSHMILLHVC